MRGLIDDGGASYESVFLSSPLREGTYGPTRAPGADPVSIQSPA